MARMGHPSPEFQGLLLGLSRFRFAVFLSDTVIKPVCETIASVSALRENNLCFLVFDTLRKQKTN